MGMWVIAASVTDFVPTYHVYLYLIIYSAIYDVYTTDLLISIKLNKVSEI